jgi:hypothetical protein
MHMARLSTPLAGLPLVIALWLAGTATGAQATAPQENAPPSAPLEQGPDSEPAGPAPEADGQSAQPPRWRYALGLKLKTDDMSLLPGNAQWRPVIGVRYGRWRFGQNTSDDWLRFSGYRKDTGLEYDWKNSEKLKIALSMRIQNITDNESFDGFSGGRNTLRGRASISYRLNPRWSIGTDFTQDLLNRGDGTTVTVGASYLWPLNDRSSLSINSGVGWATADHWQTQYRQTTQPTNAWHSGLGSLAGGISYRYSIQPQWAWFAVLNTSRALGQAAEVSPHTLTWSSQIGLLYFSR